MRSLRVLLMLVAAACRPASEPAADGGDGADGGSDADAGLSWRSALYPEDWTPAFADGEGRFLHDFSFAGYRNGEVALPLERAVGVDVVDNFGADASGQTDSTAAIQAAIDAVGAGGGGTVTFPAGLFRVDGLLSVRSDRTVLAGKGPRKSRLWFTRAVDMSDRANLTFRGEVRSGAPRPLARDAAARETAVYLEDASSLQEGDSVSVGWTITDAFIERHGMTGVWKSFNGQWKAFFRREVKGVDTSVSPHRVTLDVPLRYPALVSDGASLKVETGYLSECGLHSLALSNAVDEAAAWGSLRVHAVDFIETADCFVAGIESFAPPTGPDDGFHLQSGGIRVLDSKRVTIADTVLQKAQNRGEGGCGYLFEVSRSSEVLIRDAVGREGRHNFIQNWDFGTSGLVLLRITTAGGVSMKDRQGSIKSTGFSEFHHSLAMANLIDDSVLDDGFQAVNRKHWSSGAGHTATETVFWNTRGAGAIESHQYGQGYVIGTRGLTVNDSLFSPFYAPGAEPEDFLEGLDAGDRLLPRSLYEDQLARRRER